MRIRFSLRTLLIGFAVLCAVLALSLRFGPHLYWRFAQTKIATGVVAIPTKPLVAPPPAGDSVICRVGPFSFELPRSMSQTIDVVSGGVVFSDSQRQLRFPLPYADNRSLQNTIVGFPAKSSLSFPRLHTEVCEAQSSDFSFGMTNRELRWHQWLLTQRSHISIDLRLVEYAWRPELEGSLFTIGSAPRVFQWATVDGRWEGMIYFQDASQGNPDWIRRMCATFTVQGDPAVLWHRDEATIKSLIKITPRVEPPQE
jgi:hypothetical protein